MSHDISVSRRTFITTSAVASVGLLSAPHWSFGRTGVARPLTRGFGRLNFDVTTMGLGGQASVQWTPPDLDAAEIVVKAFKLGIRYFDTSNLYGASAVNYGRAFRLLNLAPGRPGYDEGLRRSIWLTSKTGIRWAKVSEAAVSRAGGPPPGRFSPTNGPAGSYAVEDLKRTLSLVFGDGEGNYPRGAYLDLMLAHNVGSTQDTDALFTGLDKPDPKAEAIGAYAALVDYRDGTNLTGLNPEEERLVRHIGFSCHDPGVAMELLQRDTRNIVEGMLVPINANDFNYFNFQNNTLPVAAAKNVGVIGMKVFARGNFYTPGSISSSSPDTMYREIGSKAVPSRSLVEYAVSTPGVHVAILGIGQIDSDPKRCQLTQNLSAAQIAAGSLSKTDRRAIERMAALVKNGSTNDAFQSGNRSMSGPRDAAVSQDLRGAQRVVRITWQTAYAGIDPMAEYEIWRGTDNVGKVAHTPQTTRDPFVFEHTVSDRAAHWYRIVAVDAAGQKVPSNDLSVPAMG